MMSGNPILDGILRKMDPTPNYDDGYAAGFAAAIERGAELVRSNANAFQSPTLRGIVESQAMAIEQLTPTTGDVGSPPPHLAPHPPTMGPDLRQRCLAEGGKIVLRTEGKQ